SVPPTNLIFPTPGNPYTNVFTEDGGFINVAKALFPNAGAAGPPFRVVIQSCSSPCNIPEPNAAGLFGAGLLILAGLVLLRRDAQAGCDSISRLDEARRHKRAGTKATI